MRRGPDRTILTLAALFGVAALALVWQQHRSREQLIESSALQEAVRYSEMLREFRTLYSSEVVGPVASHGIEVSHDYDTKEAAIPLPATLSMLLGERLGESGSGGQVHLYSPHPFPWREETGGLRDDFRREAWEALSLDPSEAVSRFEERAGRPVLRYATADVMRESCVGCHNSHPETPRRGWQDTKVVRI